MIDGFQTRGGGKRVKNWFEKKFLNPHCFDLLIEVMISNVPSNTIM